MPTDLCAVVSGRHGVDPDQLPMLSAAQQSPGGGTMTLEPCVQVGPLE